MITDELKKRRDRLCKLMDETNTRIREAQDFIATIPGQGDFTSGELSWKRENKQILIGKKALESSPPRVRRGMVQGGALTQFITALLDAIEKDLAQDEAKDRTS